jgi:predicted LPLAT superfamily acyltransferase
VALQGDRPRSGSRRLHGTLFGRPYELPAGPLALARQSAVPLLPVFALRTGRRAYRVLLGEPVAVDQGAGAGELQRAAERFTAQLETVIRRRPHQWFVWRELWP